MATITQSRTPKAGEDHSYSINPIPAAGCKVVWSINGQAVGVGSNVSGLEVEGIGADGTLSVEVIGDISGTNVSAVINCPPPAAPNPAPAINVSNGQPPSPYPDSEEDGKSWEDIIIEAVKTLVAPVLLPFWLLWLIVFLIIKLLEKLLKETKVEVKPSSEYVKNLLNKAGDLLPDWLRSLLDLK